VDDEDARSRYTMRSEGPSPALGKPCDTRDVLAQMGPLVTGDSQGHAFYSPVVTHGDAGLALAAFVLARYSDEGSTVWDLCSERPLMAFPAAAITMNRNYVCLSAPYPVYDKMADILVNVSYLNGECDLLGGDTWRTEGPLSNQLTVGLCRFPPSTIYILHTYTTHSVYTSPTHVS
jgi:hypothetical protein